MRLVLSMSPGRMNYKEVGEDNLDLEDDNDAAEVDLEISAI